MSDNLPPLDKLQHAIDDAKSRTGDRNHGDNNSPGPEGLGKAMRFGVELLSGIIVGCVAGYYLDRWWGTSPLFLIVLFFLGAVAGFRNLLREANEELHNNDRT